MLYAFRIKQADNTISHHGLVSAVDTSDLFWAIDEFVDPYAVEINKYKRPLSICFTTELDIEDVEDDEDGYVVPMEINHLELGDHLSNAISESKDWYIPNWKNIRG
jgi:hypothetical protein